jgi:hypothetical protein
MDPGGMEQQGYKVPREECDKWKVRWETECNDYWNKKKAEYPPGKAGYEEDRLKCIEAVQGAYERCQEGNLIIRPKKTISGTQLEEAARQAAERMESFSPKKPMTHRLQPPSGFRIPINGTQTGMTSNAIMGDIAIPWPGVLPLGGLAVAGEVITLAAAGITALVVVCAACMLPFYKYAREQMKPPNKKSDKWAHCYVSCRATKICSALVSGPCGVGYEVWQQVELLYAQATGQTPNTTGFSLGDIAADNQGIACAGIEALACGFIGSAFGLLWRESCETCCNRKYP